MTIAHLMEMLLGKLCAIEGRIGDGTPFRYTSIEQIADVLASHGTNRYGDEVMVNGMTGEQMENKMFVGIIHYQRLKHQTRDKVHARARGPRQAVTRQPNEGRSRDGGLRFGEMVSASHFGLRLLFLFVLYIYRNVTWLSRMGRRRCLKIECFFNLTSLIL
jgi:DNA-directed RNA polymerase beta subunit